MLGRDRGVNSWDRKGVLLDEIEYDGGGKNRKRVDVVNPHFEGKMFFPRKTFFETTEDENVHSKFSE